MFCGFHFRRSTIHFTSSMRFFFAVAAVVVVVSCVYSICRLPNADIHTHSYTDTYTLHTIWSRQVHNKKFYIHSVAHFFYRALCRRRFSHFASTCFAQFICVQYFCVFETCSVFFRLLVLSYSNFHSFERAHIKQKAHRNIKGEYGDRKRENDREKKGKSAVKISAAWWFQCRSFSTFFYFPVHVCGGNMEVTAAAVILTHFIVFSICSFFSQ